MRLFGITLILFATWSCHSSSELRSEQQCRNNDSLLTPTLQGYQADSMPFPLQMHKKLITLQPEEIERWKQIAAGAATSDSTWLLFGGRRLIERPYDIDVGKFKLLAVGKGCTIIGQQISQSLGANCQYIDVFIPTDQHTPCVSYFITVTFDHRSGKIVAMKDSFRTRIHMSGWDNQDRKQDVACETRQFDKPAHGASLPLN